ncbi:hypothetical protein HYY75_11670, partial [bacterium]|nr:hypothetical protein [bacterium]
KGKVKKPIVTKQLKYLKTWGTDGTIFRSRNSGESVEDYNKVYLKPHYYDPSNSSPNGLKELSKVKGIEVQLCMNELTDSKGKTVKTRVFTSRIYSRILNSKYE